jgi:hypothetical protein
MDSICIEIWNNLEYLSQSSELHSEDILQCLIKLIVFWHGRQCLYWGNFVVPECFFEFSFLFKSRRSILIMLILQTLFICSFELSCVGLVYCSGVQVFIPICFIYMFWNYRMDFSVAVFTALATPANCHSQIVHNCIGTFSEQMLNDFPQSNRRYYVCAASSPFYWDNASS